MNRRQQWQLAALALALAAGTAQAQEGGPVGYDDWPRFGHVTIPAWTWEFTTTREGDEARLQVQMAFGARATCERLTVQMAGMPVTLTTDGQKVRVRAGKGERGGQRIEASADRVKCDSTDVLTLEGQAQVRCDRKGQAAQIIKGDRVILNLNTGSLKVDAAGAIENAGPAPVSLDFGFPVAPAAEKEQPFNFFLGFSR